MTIVELAVLVFTLLSTEAYGQVGLRTSPLTSSRNHYGEDDDFDNSGAGSELSLFSKWTGMDMGQRGVRPDGIESELAAIFRGVAYGVSTTPPTTTTTTTTIKPHHHSHGTSSKYPIKKLEDENSWPNIPPGIQHIYTDSSPLPWPPIEQENPWDTETPKESPVQRPYLEAPRIPVETVLTNKEDDKWGENRNDEVLRADVSEVAWVQSLGIFWLLHVYIAAGLYSILALLALFWLARLHTQMHLLPRGYYITLHLLMFISAFLRCVHLFHDPYGAEQKLPVPLSQAVEDTAWPCLTAALAVVVLALVRAWRCPQLFPQRHYAPLSLALISSVHLLVALITHLTAAFLPIHAPPLLAAARVVTVAWGGTVGIGGLVSVWWAAGYHPDQLLVWFSRSQLDSSTPQRNPRVALLYGSRLAVASCLIQMILTALHLYTLVSPHYMNDVPPLYPWTWLAFQTANRILEFLMWLFLGFISVLPVANTSNKRSKNIGDFWIFSVLGCQCCSSSSSVNKQEKGEDSFPSVCQTNQSVANYTLQSSGKGVYQEALADPPSRRANTAIRPIKRNDFRRSATLHNKKKESNEKWNNQFPTNTTSRPSSMLFDESGFVRFKMHNDSKPESGEFLRKSEQNLDLVSQIHDLKTNHKQMGPQQTIEIKQNKETESYKNTLYYHPDSVKRKTPSSDQIIQSRERSNFEQELQNRLNLEFSSHKGECTGNNSEVASVTDYSSADARSPPNGEGDYSKYEPSTCSSISAANSFDVKMYDDFATAKYYNPTSASPHIYASLNYPTPNPHSSPKKSPRIDTTPRYSKKVSELVQCRSHSTLNVTPTNSSGSDESDQFVDYLTDISQEHATQESDSDIYSTVDQYTLQNSDIKSLSLSPRHFSKNVQKHISIHDVTPDSGLAVDYSGHTDETSGDDSESIQGQGNSSKIIKINLPANKSEYKYLNSDDIAIFQQNQQDNFPKQQHSQIYQTKDSNSTKRIRPLANRTLKGRHSDTALNDVIDDKKLAISMYPHQFTSQQEVQMLLMQQELQNRLQQDQFHQREQQEKVQQLIQQRKHEKKKIRLKKEDHNEIQSKKSMKDSNKYYNCNFEDNKLNSSNRTHNLSSQSWLGLQQSPNSKSHLHLQYDSERSSLVNDTTDHIVEARQIGSWRPQSDPIHPNSSFCPEL